MRVVSLSRKIRGGFHVATVVVLFSLIAGCTSVTSRPQAGMTSTVPDSSSRTLRAIIYFKQQTSDSKQVFAAVSEACHCQPLFVSAYSADSLIYKISLPQGEKFEAFEKTMMRDAAGLGIRIVEQDRIMQPQ